MTFVESWPRVGRITGTNVLISAFKDIAIFLLFLMLNIDNIKINYIYLIFMHVVFRESRARLKFSQFIMFLWLVMNINHKLILFQECKFFMIKNKVMGQVWGSVMTVLRWLRYFYPAYYFFFGMFIIACFCSTSAGRTNQCIGNLGKV